MRRYSDVVLNQISQPVNGANIKVTVANATCGSGALASLYSDDGITLIANPITADALGRYAFYVNTGKYDLTFSGGTPAIVSSFCQAAVGIDDFLEFKTGDSVPTSTGNWAVTGNWTFTGTETFSGPLVNTGTDTGTQTISGLKAFTANNTHTGAETHSGPETHTGAETFTTLNTQVFNNIQVVGTGTNTSVQAAYNALVGGIGYILVPPGTWPAGTSTNSNLQIANGVFGNTHILCSGMQSSFIVYTGSTAQTAVIDIGTAADGTANKSNITIEGCTVSGNANVTNAIRARGVDHSSFKNLDLRNVTGAGLLCQFCVANEFDNIHVSLNDAAFTTQPTNGIVLDGPDASHRTTTSTIKNPIIEGVSGDGIKLGNTIDIVAIAGTSEQNARGWNITVGAANTTIIGTDQEANSIEDILFNGVGLYIQNASCLSATKVHVGSTGNIASVQPGNNTCVASTIDSGGVGFTTQTGTVASGTQAMNTSAITSLNCGAVVTITSGQVQAGDAVIVNHATGGPASNNNGILNLLGFVNSTGVIGLQWCNGTAGSITPTAETVAWRVVR